MAILISIPLSFILTIIYGLKKGYAKSNPKQYIQRCLLVGVILVPIVGIAEGTLYSHGITIHWSIFGLINLSAIIIATCSVICSVKLYNYWKDNY